MMLALMDVKWIRSSVLVVLLLLNLASLLVIIKVLTYDELVAYQSGGTIKSCSARGFGFLVFFTIMGNLSSGVLSLIHMLEKSK